MRVIEYRISISHKIVIEIGQGHSKLIGCKMTVRRSDYPVLPGIICIQTRVVGGFSPTPKSMHIIDPLYVVFAQFFAL